MHLDSYTHTFILLLQSHHCIIAAAVDIAVYRHTLSLRSLEF